MAADEHVLCIPRSDATTDSAYVVVNVTSTGSAALDLKLVGTEGEVAYIGSGNSFPLWPPKSAVTDKQFM